MPDHSQHFGNAYSQILKAERQRLGLTQRELAKRVMATPVTVSHWERGKTLPDLYHRQRLGAVFNKSPEELGFLQEKLPSQASKGTAAIVEEKAGTGAELWYVPYPRNPYFTGRETVFESLREALETSGTAALIQPQAVSGLGGIGKTQIVIEYAYRQRAEYTSVLWVRADSRELLLADFALLAGLLHLSVEGEGQQDGAVSAMKNWLERQSHWLLILDNADDLEVVAPFLPTLGQGHILVTTRALATGTIARGIEVEKLDLDQGALFLLRRAKLLPIGGELENIGTEARASAMEITRQLDGLPLALDQAGAYIEETGCALADYLALYLRNHERLLGRRGRFTLQHSQPVTTTWSLSFARIEEEAPAAAELLRLCAFLHADGIPEDLLSAGAEVLPAGLREAVGNELDLNEALHELRRFAFVRRDPETRTLSIHRLVQAVLRAQLTEEERRDWKRVVVRLLALVFPDAEAITAWPRCQRYLAQAWTAATVCQEEDLCLPEAAPFLDRLADYLIRRGQYAEVEPLLQRALCLRQGLPEVAGAPSLNCLGVFYRKQGRYEQAKPLLQRALELREAALGPQHQDIAYSLDELATFYLDLDQLEQAETLYQRSIAMYKRTLGPEHARVASVLNNLGVLNWKQGNYEQAEERLERALMISARTLPANHPDRASNLNNLATLYYVQKKYAESEDYFRRALVIEEEVLGREHPDVGMLYNNLGWLNWRLGHYSEADHYFKEALRTAELSLGTENPDLALPLNGLAQVAICQGDYAQAEPFLLRSLAIQERLLAWDHPSLALTLLSFRLLYQHQGWVDEEAEFAQRLAAIPAENRQWSETIVLG